MHDCFPRTTVSGAARYDTQLEGTIWFLNRIDQSLLRLQKAARARLSAIAKGHRSAGAQAGSQ